MSICMCICLSVCLSVCLPLFVLSRLRSSLWVSRTRSASDWCALQEALHKCIDTIQYNSIINYGPSMLDGCQLGLPRIWKSGLEIRDYHYWTDRVLIRDILFHDKLKTI